MKKIFFVAVLVLVLLAQSLYAFDTTLRDIRTEVYTESNEIKALMRKTRDPVLVSSIYDSCLITITQLDAYFHMLNIFNTIERKNLKQEALDSLMTWLVTTKNMNDLNIMSLGDTTQAFDRDTKTHMKKLKKIYSRLNEKIDAERKKIDSIKRSLRLP